jgi:hypothetical protein
MNTADNIDTFASFLLEEAKRFLERAVEAKGGNGEMPNLHAALLLAVCALEGHVNSVADEMAQRDGVTAHEKGILLERDVRLVNGKFALETALRIWRLEDRLSLIHARFAVYPVSDASWRSRLSSALDLRNKLTHPKEIAPLTIAAVRNSIQAILDTIDALYVGLYNRPYPMKSLGLTSKLSF